MDAHEPLDAKPRPDLRRGWTTGACAAAAAKAAFTGLVSGTFPDPVEITLPNGAKPQFTLARAGLEADRGMAAIVKDAGDDPDVTHGALIVVRVARISHGAGLRFLAGDGVGTVTKPGLPLAVGEPAINPAPRKMIASAIADAAVALGVSADAEVEISIPGGQALALKTLNPRLGILGGLSVLGTTGIVIPFSCAAWIHSIHRGIDVARAEGLTHIAGATGATSEAAIAALDGLPDTALIDMGDFVGGMLKYLRQHPTKHVTIAGGFAKMVKLSQGLLDLHSRSGSVDLIHLAGLAHRAGGQPALLAAITEANSALHVLELASASGLDLAGVVADEALQTASAVVAGSGIALDVAVFDRSGRLLARRG
jgi:cobalt-precorrin-5B (C1)-methyltransferase